MPYFWQECIYTTITISTINHQKNKRNIQKLTQIINLIRYTLFFDNEAPYCFLDVWSQSNPMSIILSLSLLYPTPFEIKQSKEGVLCVWKSKVLRTLSNFETDHKRAPNQRVDIILSKMISKQTPTYHLCFCFINLYPSGRALETIDDSSRFKI